jgi:hypothetical protein
MSAFHRTAFYILIAATAGCGDGTSPTMSDVSGAPTMQSGAAVMGPAVDFDPVRDFSAIRNPNHQWAYATKQLNAINQFYPGLLGLSEKLRHGLYTWQQGPGEQGSYPFIRVNILSGSLQHDGTIYPPNLLVMHPSSAGDYSILEWRVKDAGTYQIDAEFSDILNSSPATTDVYVQVNAEIIFMTVLSTLNEKAVFSRSLSLNKDALVHFVVGFGPNMNNIDDHTGLKVRIRQLRR